MKKKTYRTLLLLFLFLVIFPISAAALTLPYFGTTSETNYLWADSTYGDDDITSVDYVSRGSASIEWYRNVGSKATYISSTSVNAGSGTVTPPGGTAALKLKSNGSEIFLTHIRTTNPNSIDIYFEEGNSGGGNDGGSNGGGGDNGGVVGNTGDCGCIFRTPGWQEYMGKVDDIIAAIPPPPNWNNVAGTFSDKIVPRLLNGVDDMLGRAPSLPSKPGSPGTLNDGNLKKPTGRDSGLDGFNESDIKGGDRIKEREDESGGWDILDPLESMPEQETFVPEEGDLKAPEVPDVEGEAPEPEEPENQTPSNPKEPENVAPTPDEPDNPTPTPDDPGGTAPTPNEPENQTPSNPKEPENVAPTPDEPSNTAPTPGESENQFPIPGENNSSYPMPGSGSNKAPIPGRDNTQAPMPGQSGLQAPMPGG